MDAQALADVMGNSLSLSRYEELLPQYERFMRYAQITTVERSAMAAAQLGHESVGLLYQEEISDGSAYEGRTDLGNVYPGDGPRFKGHGWIQVTGRHNHTAVSQWAFERGIVSSPSYFVDNPTALGSDEFCWVGPAWYWSDARPNLNVASDQRDLVWATRMINGGTNGLADRSARYDRALGMGDRILPSGEVPAPAVVHPMRDEVFRVSSGFRTAGRPDHQGLDFAADEGTAMYAVADGVVIQGADRPEGSVAGFGNWVWLDCQASVGRDFIYGHMPHSSILVSAGDYVRAGDKVAEVGSEGQSTGPHLHFEVWTGPGRSGGRAEDPAVWLAENVNNGTTSEGELTVAEADRIIRELSEYLDVRVTDPIGSDVKDIRQQLTGGRDRGEYPGWPQLEDKTLVDAVADLAVKVADVREQLTGSREVGKYEGWPQLGLNTKGNNLAVTDAIAALRQQAVTLQAEVNRLVSALNKNGANNGNAQ